mmetsp:Transcript_11582/g.18444  ORF Transcript_11582/g.18444 Transcript_11582/m.18444 type:complete len:123 (-) Transcript_11582:403-771(-)|eukprot:CAMPEP_0115135820 /NCGR_PEP_ID=MMETSP0227-20121206/55976_1 /TAXON_ID=89957 /ORGANISM="Polarella glacialis, Strain CCMP 1383" /LENGTH=122 /DNA_ID=CAMNT_0002542677 /DNA_START=265 /DNA_END=633 /DNA_ORIENTATION=-
MQAVPSWERMADQAVSTEGSVFVLQEVLMTRGRRVVEASELLPDTAELTASQAEDAASSIDPTTDALEAFSTPSLDLPVDVTSGEEVVEPPLLLPSSPETAEVTASHAELAASATEPSIDEE